MKRSAISAYLYEHLRECRQEDDGLITGKIVFAPDFPGFAGHFPEYPLVPGVCLVETVRCAFEKAMQFPVVMTKLKSCRFRAQIVPDTEIGVKITLKSTDSGSYQLQAEIFTGETSALRLSMTVKKESDHAA